MSDKCLAELTVKSPPHTEFRLEAPVARLNPGRSDYYICGLPKGHDGPHDTMSSLGARWPNTGERRQTTERKTMWRPK